VPFLRFWDDTGRARWIRSDLILSFAAVAAGTDGEQRNQTAIDWQRGPRVTTQLVRDTPFEVRAKLDGTIE